MMPLDDDVTSVAELNGRYAAARRRLMGPPPRRIRRKFESPPPPPPPPPPPEPEPTSSLRDLPFPDEMPLEEKVAALLSLVPPSGPARLPRLIKITAEAFGISVADLCGTSRFAKYCIPRQIAMTIAAVIFGVSLPATGRAFGGRDHTTVLCAKRKYGDLIHAACLTRSGADARIEADRASCDARGEANDRTRDSRDSPPH